MGLDATICRINLNVESSSDYEAIASKKWLDLNKDVEKFDKWRNGITEEIFYTSNFEISSIIRKMNTGLKKVDLQNNEELILDKKDIQKIINLLRASIKEPDIQGILRNEYSDCIIKLETCLITTDFKNQTIIYGEWF